MSKISENIKNLRLSNNMTQEKLAEKLSVTRQTVSCWENGKSEPDIDTLMKISTIFDIDMNTLLYSETNVKKSHRWIKIFAIILFFIILIFTLLFQNKNNITNSFYNVLQNPYVYSVNLTEIRNRHFELYETNNKIKVFKNDLDNSEYISITGCEYSEDGTLTIRGKTVPIYQDNNGGKIFIPAVYSNKLFPETEDFLNSIRYFDKNISKTKNSNGGIITENENPFASEYLYYSYPVSYKINKDGSVEFEFVFEKTAKKTIEELISEHSSPLIVLRCVTIEWETKEVIGNIYDKTAE